MQLRSLQKPRAVGRLYAHGHGFAVARHPQPDFAAGRAARPDLAPEAGKARHLLIADRQNAVTGAQPRESVELRTIAFFY